MLVGADISADIIVYIVVIVMPDDTIKRLRDIFRNHLQGQKLVPFYKNFGLVFQNQGFHSLHKKQKHVTK